MDGHLHHPLSGDPTQHQVEDQIITTIHHCRNDSHFAEFLFEIFLYEMAGASTKASVVVGFEELQLSAHVARTLMLNCGDDPGASKHTPPLLFDMFIATAPYAPSPEDVYMYLIDEWRVNRLFTKDVRMDRPSPSRYPLSCSVPKPSQADHDHFQTQYARIRPQFQDRYAAIVHACRKYVWQNQGSGGVSVMVRGLWSVEKYTSKYNGEILKKLGTLSSNVVERPGRELASPPPPPPLSNGVDPNAGGEAAKSKSASKKAKRKAKRNMATTQDNDGEGEAETRSSTTIDTLTASSSSQSTMATEALATATKMSPTPTPPPIKDIIDAERAAEDSLENWILQQSTVLDVMNTFNVAELRRRDTIEVARQRAIAAGKERNITEAFMKSKLRRLCRRGIEINEAQAIIRKAVRRAINKAKTKAHWERVAGKREAKQKIEQMGKTTPATSAKESAMKPLINGTSPTSTGTSTATAANSSNSSSSNDATQKKQQQSEKELAKEIVVKYQEFDFFLDEFSRLATPDDAPGPSRFVVMGYLRRHAKKEIESHWDARTQPLMPVLVQYLHILVRAGNISSKISVQLLRSMRETTLEEKLNRPPLGGDDLMSVLINHIASEEDDTDNLDADNACDVHGNPIHVGDTHSDDCHSNCYDEDDDEAFGQDSEDSEDDDYDIDDDYGVPARKSMADVDDEPPFGEAFDDIEEDQSWRQAQADQELESDPGTVSEDYEDMSLEEMTHDIKHRVATERSYKASGPVAWSMYCHRERERMESLKDVRRAKEARRVAEEAARVAKEKVARIAKEKTERKQAERLARVEVMRLAKEKADRRAKEKADRAAKAEADRRAKEEANRLAKEEADRIAKEEADRRAKEEADRRAKEEADRLAKAEAQRRAREEAELKAREEAERRAREEAELKAREEAQRRAKEEAQRRAREEAERRAKEEAEQLAKKNSERLAEEEAERIAQEKADREEAERLGKLQAKEEEERRAKDEAAWAAATAAVAKAKAKANGNVWPKANPQSESRPYTAEELDSMALESARNSSRGKTDAEMDAITKELRCAVDQSLQEHLKFVQTKLEGEDQINTKAANKAAAKAAKVTRKAAAEAAAMVMSGRAEREYQEELRIKARMKRFKADRVQEILEMREEAQEEAKATLDRPRRLGAWSNGDMAAVEKYDAEAPEQKMIEERTRRHKKDRYLEIEAMRRDAKIAASVAELASSTGEWPASPFSSDESGAEDDQEELEDLEQLELLKAQVESSLLDLETMQRKLRAQIQVTEDMKIKEEKMVQEKAKALEMMRLKQEAEKNELALAQSRGEPVRLPNNGAVYFDWQSINFGLSLWKTTPMDHFRAMDITINEWHLDLLPSQDSINSRHGFLARLQTIFDMGFPGQGLELRPFGSFVTGLGNNWSDIDICIFSENHQPYALHSNIPHLAEFLRSKGMKQVVAITDAKVPIIKFVDHITGIACDMNVQHPLGIYNSYLINAYLEIDARLGKFLHLLKHFASRHGILDGASGFLCSYAYILMAIVFFQEQKEAILPRLQVKGERPRTYNSQGKSRKQMATFAKCQVDGSVAAMFAKQDSNVFDCSFDTRVEYYKSYGIMNKKTVARLLFEFFEFFARKFDYRTMEVSTVLGKVQERHSLLKEKRQHLASEKLLGSAGAANAMKTANSTNPYLYDSKRQIWLNAAEQVYFKDMDTNDGVPSGAVPVPDSTVSTPTATYTNAGATTPRGGYQDRFGSEAFLCVMDPFMVNRNVAGTCRGERLAKVWKCFDHGYKCLALGNFIEAFEPISDE